MVNGDSGLEKSSERKIEKKTNQILYITSIIKQNNLDPL